MSNKSHVTLTRKCNVSHVPATVARDNFLIKKLNIFLQEPVTMVIDANDHVQIQETTNNSQ